MTRDEAIKWLERIEERYINGGDEAYDAARKEALHMAIESLERKRGEWKICDAKPPTWWYECSVCGNAGNIEYNYCPNCGAEMKHD